MNDAQRRWYFAHLAEQAKAGAIGAAAGAHPEVIPAAEAAAQAIVPEVPGEKERVPASSIWSTRRKALGEGLQVLAHGAKAHIVEHQAGMAATALGGAATVGGLALARAMMPRFRLASTRIGWTPKRVALEEGALAAAYWGGVVPAQHYAQHRWKQMEATGRDAQAQRERSLAYGAATAGAAGLIARDIYPMYKVLRHMAKVKRVAAMSKELVRL